MYQKWVGANLHRSKLVVIRKICNEVSPARQGYALRTLCIPAPPVSFRVMSLDFISTLLLEPPTDAELSWRTPASC